MENAHLGFLAKIACKTVVANKIALDMVDAKENLEIVNALKDGRDYHATKK